MLGPCLFSRGRAPPELGMGGTLLDASICRRKQCCAPTHLCRTAGRARRARCGISQSKPRLRWWTGTKARTESATRLERVPSSFWWGARGCNAEGRHVAGAEGRHVAGAEGRHHVARSSAALCIVSYRTTRRCRRIPRATWPARPARPRHLSLPRPGAMTWSCCVRFLRRAVARMRPTRWGETHGLRVTWGLLGSRWHSRAGPQRRPRITAPCPTTAATAAAHIRAPRSHCPMAMCPQKTGATNLHWAAEHGRTDLARALLEGMGDKRKPDPRDGEGRTPLFLAAAKGAAAVKSALVDGRGARCALLP
jgi:hypothetical protein